MPDLKLGKRPARHDIRTLNLADYLQTEALPPIPAARSWDRGVKNWGVMLNDRLGCCVLAARGHAEQLVTVNATGAMVTVPDSVILADYERVAGYDPRNPASDQGTDMIAACNDWRTIGCGGHTIAAYAACPLQQPFIEACIDLFGFCYIGFLVPQSAMDQFSAGKPWTVVSGSPIIGGHCVCLVDYDATGATAITWGSLQRGDWNFWLTEMDEAFGVVTKEWIAANGQAPSGFDLPTLLADVAALSGQPPPQPVQTTTVLSVSPNPATTAQPVTLRAAVAGSNPTGSVAFTLDGQPIVAASTLANGAAQSTIAGLAPGSHSVTARYGGDAGNAASQSAAVSLTVTEPQPVVDPYVLAWCQWQADDAAYVLDRLKRGDAAGALAQEKLLSANAPGIATLLAGAKSAGFSATPPAVPS